MASLFLSRVDRGWLDTIRADAVTCEARRPFTRKPAATGTISESACLYLRAIVETVQPRVCIEIGTFIGTSALVLAATGATVYTCDKDNDVVPGTEQVVCYPKTASTGMLEDLRAKQVAAELFFFDGRIHPERDLPLIAALSHRRTVYAFDDFEGRAKGVINVRLLHPRLRGYRLIPPPATVLGLASRTTIAALVPEGLR